MPFELAILQHPTEVGHPKGTAWLAHQCLVGSRLFIGERIAELPDLVRWLSQGDTYLLYPPQDGEQGGLVEASSFLCQVLVEQPKSRLLVLDGTWRKTYKLLMANPVLQGLPRVILNGEFTSNYSIRQSGRLDSLSTIEAIFYLLHQADNSCDYTSLLRSFEGLVKQHQGFVGGIKKPT